MKTGRKKSPCWSGYEMIGTKKKREGAKGKTVVANTKAAKVRNA